MRIPLIAHVATLSQTLPILATLRHGRTLPEARRWIVVWAVVLLVYDGTSLWLGAVNSTGNLWIGYISGPLEVGAALMALSLWQYTPLSRIAFRYAIPVFAVAWVALVVLVEDTSTFSLTTGPLKSLLLLSASVGTLLVCVLRHEGGLLRQDWFWVCLGLALRYGSNTALDPIARVLGQDFSALDTLYQSKAWLDVVASLVIARGILCPIPPPQPSSGPMSPASFPSPSSSLL